MPEEPIHELVTDTGESVIYDTDSALFIWYEGDGDAREMRTAETLEEAYIALCLDPIRKSIIGALWYYIKPTDREDAIQEGVIAVLRALREASKTGATHTLAWYRTRAVNYARTWCRDHVYKHENHMHLNDGETWGALETETLLCRNHYNSHGCPDGGDARMCDAVDSIVLVEQFAAYVEAQGHPRRAMIIRALALTGHGIDAARMLGVSGQAVSNHLEGIRKAAREFLLV